MTYSHPAADTYPWFIRLSIDVDPSGNPIGRHATLFERGVEKAMLGFQVPDPFDTIADAFADLITDYTDQIGTQMLLF